MFRSSRLLALVFLFSTPAFGADCPTRETARLGFVLERQGITTEVQPEANHFVHAVNLYPGERRQDVIYYRGLFPISRFDARTRSINIPVSDLRAIFPLELKARRTLTYAPAEPDRVEALISLELTVTGEERLQLEACSYNVLSVRNRFLNAEGKTTSEFTDLYSPELGYVLAKRYEGKNGTHTLVKYQSIRPLRRSSPL